jgi:hypothetical protein
MIIPTGTTSDPSTICSNRRSTTISRESRLRWREQVVHSRCSTRQQGGLWHLRVEVAVLPKRTGPQGAAIDPRCARRGARHRKVLRRSRVATTAQKVEMLFAHLKRILKLDRLRLRGPTGARDEFLLAAAAQNLRKLAKLIPMQVQTPHNRARHPLHRSRGLDQLGLTSDFFNKIGPDPKGVNVCSCAANRGKADSLCSL